ncbi:dolichol-phosphate mannosyltransferase [Gillisia mitskevichiae]|uniref:Dolichol-phosphate mannosyltransferase n=1 Tax=Gillisia mitskevichiae TaxID=270921 RepID=A0A495PIN0_9FLAO|nr:glycosyltransferase family 2 protein [Gillisia mitskevichiae]RKS50601.1 dolichol-phosphate mannosyltransferase [Gillisia mitskevichiae]
MPYLSIVSPVYNAEKIIPALVERIESSIQKITSDYEIILVEDCGPDNSWEVIENITNTNPKIIGIKLSRNFGQHYAITAGLDHAKGDWVVVMDCDLQDQPEEIEKLYKKAQEGFDIVLGRRFDRKDRFFKKFFSKMFYRTLGYLTGSEQDESVANFGIYNRNVVNAVVSMRESIRYFPTMVKWVGFKSTKVNVEHDDRNEGESSYNLKRLINLALDIILAYSDKPIRLLIKTGLFISVISVLVASIYFIKWLKGDVLVLGYTSLIISLWLLSGIILSTLGIIGLYVGKTFEGVKNRPIYIIKKIINNK